MPLSHGGRMGIGCVRNNSQHGNIIEILIPVQRNKFIVCFSFLPSNLITKPYLLTKAMKPSPLLSTNSSTLLSNHAYYITNKKERNQFMMINQKPIAMAYVPWQKFKDIYEPPKALMVGTIFKELDLPFTGKPMMPMHRKGGSNCGCN